ncbi:MAG: B12-binding domain-containing radical SAM protein [Deltaproteobacteria bacterium]|nr:B12-binding domain-containing radical SAM protein [Candidatus Zymogenaceae bacterium]
MDRKTTEKKKLSMIFPDFEGTPLAYRAFVPPLGLLTLAALTPPEFEIGFVDERSDTINFDEEADVVAISAMTPQAARAYEIADRFRARGVRVVMGGPHPSLLPEEALLHADAVVVGEAENIWCGVLSDVLAGRSAGIYVCRRKPDLSGLPFPRHDLLNEANYLPIRSIQVTRGCPLNCEFCTVPKNFGREYRIRPTDDVLSEIERLPSHLYFVDDNLMIKRRSFTGLFDRMGDMDKRWTGMAPLAIASDAKYVDLLARSGCWSMYVDVGPWLSVGLRGDVSSLKEQVSRSVGYIKKLQDAGIKVMGSFVFGFDYDEEPIFEATLKFLLMSGIVEAEFLILTPYPNTPLAEKLEAQDRIVSRDWSRYNTTHAVFRPARMTPEILEEGVGYLWREFYRQTDLPEGFVLPNVTAEARRAHERILSAVPILFRDMAHEGVLTGLSGVSGKIGVEQLVRIWKSSNPPIFTRIVGSVYEELGYKQS